MDRSLGAAADATPRAAGTGGEGASVFPASFAQQRLWLVDKLHADIPLYNCPRAYRLRGALDVAALRNALNAVVARHEVLRTHFRVDDGTVVQVVRERLTLPLHVEPVDGPHAGDRESEAMRRYREEALALFDLDHGPLIRARLLRLAPLEHWLLLTLHHVVTDGWSTRVLHRELFVLYQALLRGADPTMPPLPIQYSEYAILQHQAMRGGAFDESLRYWTRKLAHVPALEFPTDRPRRSTRTFRGCRVTLEADDRLTASLGRISRQEGATTFMTLLAAFQLLLARHCGQDDIAVGAPTAGRLRRELEGSIGLFVNMLVLRTDLGGDPSFRELLRRVRDVCVNAYVRQELPFEKLVEEINPSRDINRNPLFDVVLNLFGANEEPLRLKGLEVKSIPFGAELSKFPITLYVQPSQASMRFELDYQEELFAAPRMRDFLQQYHRLLAQIADDPDRSIHRYTLVTPSARSQLPDPSRIIDAPSHEPALVTIEQWAARRPDAIAIAQGQRRWSYSELVTAAHRIASAIASRGVRSASVVAIVAPRCFGLVATMLGTWLGGAAFLAIDPTLPARRQRTMLDQARPAAVCRVGAVSFPSEVGEAVRSLPVIDVDAEDGRVAPATGDAAPASRPLPMVGEDDPAYVFFTSGSTGVPLGVVGTQKGLAHFLAWQRSTFSIGPDDNVAQSTALSFDPLLRDVFLPLTAGARLTLPEEDDQFAPLSWIERAGITVLHAVPSLLQSWLANDLDRAMPGVRWLFVAGEPLSRALVDRCRSRFACGTAIVNLYGPTETTLAKCFQIVPTEATSEVQPVGFPLPQTQALVLNRAGRLSGIGEVGEVVLRTPFRTLGYLDAPDAMQARFLPNPFRDDPSDLVFRTGDLGRYRPDGSLDLLGRLDDQVKIRGIRIEPAEVKATLETHPCVRAAFVLGERMPDENRLVAYVVPDRRQPVNAPELRSFLATRLPAAAVPTAWHFLGDLPRLPNGKIDRRSLPIAGIEIEKAPRAGARDALEDRIVAILAEMLPDADIGIHDNFFDLGGHSLLAMRFLARLREALGVEWPVRVLFEAPTIAEIALRLRNEQAHPAHDCPQIAPILPMAQ